MVLADFCIWLQCFCSMLWTPLTKSVLSTKLESPPTCFSIEKELRQEPDARSTGTSTQTWAPKELCNTTHRCWMNLHILGIKQLLKHGLLELYSTQAHLNLRTQKRSVWCFQHVRKQQIDQSLKSPLASLSDRHYGNNAVSSSLSQISTTQLFIMHRNNFVKALTPHNKQNEISLSNPNEVDWTSLFISRDAECIFYTCCLESLSSNSTEVSPCTITSSMHYSYSFFKFHDDQLVTFFL